MLISLRLTVLVSCRTVSAALFFRSLLNLCRYIPVLSFHRHRYISHVRAEALYAIVQEIKDLVSDDVQFVAAVLDDRRIFPRPVGEPLLCQDLIHGAVDEHHGGADALCDVREQLQLGLQTYSIPVAAYPFSLVGFPFLLIVPKNPGEKQDK